MNESDAKMPDCIQREDTKVQCRICLLKLDGNLKSYSLFDPWDPPWSGMEPTVVEDLTKLTNIEVSKEDAFPKHICEICYHRLKNVCRFVKLTITNDQILRSRIYPQFEINISSEFIWPKPIQLEKHVADNIYDNKLDIKIKQELLSEEDNVDALMNYEYMNNLDSIKIEPEEITSQNPSSIKGVAGTAIESPCLPNGVHKKECVDQAVKEEPLSEEETEWLDPPLCTKAFNSVSGLKCVDPAVKEEPLSEEETERLDLPLDCLLCTKAFNSVSGLKAHVIAQHSYQTVKRRTKAGRSPAKKPRRDTFVCATCRRTFFTSTDLMVHETCHSNLACYMCNQHFDTFDQLTQHRTRCKATNEEPVRTKTLDDVKRPVKEVKSEKLPADLGCPQCPERFTDSYYMHIHTEIHHSQCSSDNNDAPTSDVIAETNKDHDEIKSENTTLAIENKECAYSEGVSSKSLEKPNENVSSSTETSEAVGDVDMPEKPALLEESAFPEEPILPEEPKVTGRVTALEAGSLEAIFGVVNPESKSEKPALLEESALPEEPILPEEPKVTGRVTALEAGSLEAIFGVVNSESKSEKPALLEESALPEEPILPEEPKVTGRVTALEAGSLEAIFGVVNSESKSEKPALLEESAFPEEPILPEEPKVTGRVTALETDSLEAIFGVVNSESKSEVDL